MVIVDTTVWIDYFAGTINPEAAWLDREATRQRLGLTDLILCEVLQGIRDSAEFKRVREELLTFHIFPTGGVGMAVAAAENYRALRQSGYTVRKTIDCWIATFCLLTGNELLHRDRDFDPFEKVLRLQVVHA
ncbi:MAG: PIN domain nuclease [Acidobacteriales bacterium]|nr:PIN domain nuclease [Candidatus Koribacter versatilis]MBI3645146.1 PIN domain nuclease [Terriglobales bacterium]